MAKEKQTSNQNETVKCYDNIPMNVVENMTPEVRIQYFYWDELLKRQIQVHPIMFLPLVKETFGKEYPEGTDITVLSTEYVTDKPYAGGKLIESIRSDLVIRIGSKDLYHMECQIKQGGNIAVRMLEYDVNAALVHGLERMENDQKGKNVHPYKYMLRFPKSAILYLDSTERTPDEESCIMVLPNGMEYEYSIPVLKAQAYTPEMMAQKELTILFPFSPIRFRRRLDTILEMEKKSSESGKIQEMRDALKKDLTKFILDCIMIINREEENGTLRGGTGADIVEYMGRTCDYIFNKEPELLKGVHEVMEPVIKLIREEAEDTFKLLREQKEEELSLLREQKEGELNLLREKMDDELNLLREQKEGELNLLREKMDDELNLLREQKEGELNLLREKKEGELNLLREQKEAEIMQMEDQLDKFIQNYIIQCKKEGKLKGQVEKELQSNFSLPLQNVRLKMEKWW